MNSEVNDEKKPEAAAAADNAEVAGPAAGGESAGTAPAGEPTPEADAGVDAPSEGDAGAAGTADFANLDMSEFEESLGETSELASALSQLTQAQDDLARVRADLYNLNQQYTNYVRRTKADAAQQRAAGQAEVCEALLVVLDDIEAARQHGDLKSGPLAGIAKKLEDTLHTRFGLESFGEAGEEFDPNRHEALLASTGDVEQPVVKTVLQPGYQVGDKVVRPAKVAVENPQ